MGISVVTRVRIDASHYSGHPYIAVVPSIYRYAYIAMPIHLHFDAYCTPEFDGYFTPTPPILSAMSLCMQHVSVFSARL